MRNHDAAPNCSPEPLRTACTQAVINLLIIIIIMLPINDKFTGAERRTQRELATWQVTYLRQELLPAHVYRQLQMY
jgi:hypothetical protein